MRKKQDEVKNDIIKVFLKSNFNISGTMYQKGVHLLKKEDVDYLKNSPLKKNVEFL